MRFHARSSLENPKISKGEHRMKNHQSVTLLAVDARRAIGLDSNLFHSFYDRPRSLGFDIGAVNRPPESSRALRIPVRKNAPGLQVRYKARHLRTSWTLGLRSSPHRVSYQQPFADRAAGR